MTVSELSWFNLEHQLSKGLQAGKKEETYRNIIKSHAGLWHLLEL